MWSTKKVMLFLLLFLSHQYILLCYPYNFVLNMFQFLKRMGNKIFWVFRTIGRCEKISRCDSQADYTGKLSFRFQLKIQGGRGRDLQVLEMYLLRCFCKHETLVPMTFFVLKANVTSMLIGNLRNLNRSGIGQMT